MRSKTEKKGSEAKRELRSRIKGRGQGTKDLTKVEEPGLLAFTGLFKGAIPNFAFVVLYSFS